jgi:hypothetical protein
MPAAYTHKNKVFSFLSSYLHWAYDAISNHCSHITSMNSIFPGYCTPLLGVCCPLFPFHAVKYFNGPLTLEMRPLHSLKMLGDELLMMKHSISEEKFLICITSEAPKFCKTQFYSFYPAPFCLSAKDHYTKHKVITKLYASFVDPVNF